MSKKGKGLIFYGSDDAKTRLKHQTLVQEFVELQEETYAKRTKLEAAKHRKLVLAAEVRFLRRRYKLLAETKRLRVLQEEKLEQPPKSVNLLKHKKQLLPRRGGTHSMLPPRPETKLKKRHYVGEGTHSMLPPRPETKLKKRHYVGEEVGIPSSSSRNDHNIKKRLGAKEMSVLNYNGRKIISREQIAWEARVFDLNQSNTLFDLNQDTTFIRKDASLPTTTRTPIFDLNEISMGDEDFQSNVDAVKLEEVKKSLIRGINDEQQKDLALSVCRNEGEGSPHVGKRKISWQDPVALWV